MIGLKSEGRKGTDIGKEKGQIGDSTLQLGMKATLDICTGGLDGSGFPNCHY